MSEFLLRLEDAEAEGQNVMTTADEIQHTIDALQMRLGNLEASLKGQTQLAFQEKMAELHGTETQVMTALNDLGNFLIRAAGQFNDADQSAAAALRGA